MPFPLAYLLTLAVEVPVGVAACAAAGVGRWQRSLPAALTASLVTVPLLWFVAMPLLDPAFGWIGAVIVGEAAVVVMEAGIYVAWLRCRFGVALAVSLGANALSVLVGMCVTALRP